MSQLAFEKGTDTELYSFKKGVESKKRLKNTVLENYHPTNTAPGKHDFSTTASFCAA